MNEWEIPLNFEGFSGELNNVFVAVLLHVFYQTSDLYFRIQFFT